MEESPDAKPKISKKRQKILEKAFAQLRKARGQMDPALLKNIRRMIAGSPDMMKKLGVGDDLKPEQAKSPKAPSPSKPAHTKPPTPKVQEQRQQQQQQLKVDKSAASDEKAAKHEKIDQAKNMEVMAKLLELNPDGRDKIIATIKKAGD